MNKQRIVVHTGNRTKDLGDLFGIFFEDLNHAADGGLYAELIQNRSFEYDRIDNIAYHSLTGWEKLERGSSAVELHVECHAPLHPKNPHYLVMEISMDGEGGGIRNLGYNTGIPLVAGETYHFSCYARNRTKEAAPLSVQLESADGGNYASAPLVIDSAEWKRYTLTLTPDHTDHAGRLALFGQHRAMVELDMISLFPEHTFLRRENGMRLDIAQLLSDMKPKFMRFPGGCLVHDGSLDPDDRNSMYRWKNTIGPIEHRPSKRSNWGYNQSLGLGFFEYFCFAEDIGAKPLPVIPAGYDPHHRRMVPLDEMQPWIDDALDLIEFANGDASTHWGKLRCELGHPEPFHLEYLAIGNEEVGKAFFERYAIIHDQIRAKHPEIKLINSAGPYSEGSEYERGWCSAREHGSDLIDEHYYCSPEWFLANIHRYDDYDPHGPKVFLGEYASWGSKWRNALIEAAYMTGLEKAPAVGLACYAPLLCNADYANWKPDLIWYDNHRAYGTASYYVQKLFMNHQGDHEVEIEAIGFASDEIIPPILNGELAVISTNVSVSYTSLVLSTNAESVRCADFTTDACKPYKKLGSVDGDFTLQFTATKNGPSPQKSPYNGLGLEIRFAIQDDDNHMALILGGWQNQDCFIRSVIHGTGVEWTQSLFTMLPNRPYDCELSVRGNEVSVRVDGELLAAVQCKPQRIEPLYLSSSIEDATGDVIIKAANVTERSQSAEIMLDGCSRLHWRAYTLCSALDDENNFDRPNSVSPVEETFVAESNVLERVFPAHSVTVLRASHEKER